MRKLLAEFKDFINKGDVVTIAVGLIIALYFAAIVERSSQRRDLADHLGNLRTAEL